ncbi:MerR family transcriptional regulator [Amycolatopsis sp. TRM77291]
MFPTGLTSVLSGASVAQLRSWNRTGLLVPEVATEPYLLYSYRDVVALRSVVHLRREQSLQKIRKAFTNANELDFSEHPSRYLA